MRPVGLLSVARGRRGLALAVTIGACLAVSAVAALAATSALPPPQVLNYQAYVGGKGKANPKLSPVTLGFINGQGGPPNFNFPQATHVIEAEVKMINAELGGVHGHPLKLNECFWAQAEEEGVRCGQKMVNDKNTKAIIFGFVTVGNQSIYATVKGTKPIVGVVTANPADPTAKNAFFLNGSQTSVLGPFGTYTKRFLPKVKTAAIVYPTDPGADTAAIALKKGLQQVGLKVTVIGVPPLSTDLLGAATQASSSDMIVAALGFTTCVPFARAIDQIHYTKPVLSTPICTFLPQGGLCGRRHPEVDLRHRSDAGESARPAVEAVSEEGHPVRGDRQRPALGLRGGRLGADARHREDHELDPVQQAHARRRSSPGSRPSAVPPCSGRRRSHAARCPRESPPPAATRPSSTTTPAKASGRWPPAG